MATSNLAVINGTCPAGSAVSIPGYRESEESDFIKWRDEQQSNNLAQIGMLIEEAGIGYLCEDEATQRAKIDEVRAAAEEIVRLCNDWYELDRL
ncbi:hypothetical protein [uncultured Pseudodesulfovibrio sp.]|uniref:hypothetical protein n=1 Tax=uncultured Pseudodesulfovibrio sp. TaxID=2035858 RepID=UPI0029C78685|nr:hypothetical protein [uncultured Pseudodesulfovibrio sp.]